MRINKEQEKSGRRGLIFSFLIVGLVSLVQPGCDCSSSSGGSTSPSVITAVSPENNNFSNLVSTLVSVQFSVDMDPTSVANSISISSGGMPVTATVVYNPANRIATLTPDSDLLSGVSYVATVLSGVLDSNGNMPLSSDFVWSFGISESVQLVSKTVAGVVSNQASQASDLDSDGRYTVFESTATNFSATTNGRSHIYRKDNVTGEVILVSSDASGLVEANNNSFNPAVSDDGRFVVFESSATNLDPAASLGTTQIFLKDLTNGAVKLVSSDNLGQPDNSFNTAANASISNDGQIVVFESAATNLSVIASGGISQVYRKNTITESVEMISRDVGNNAGNSESINPAMSSDGTHIVFESIATNMNASSAFRHIYYVNTSITHAVVTASVTSGGVDANGNSSNPSISDDGLNIVFESTATNLDVNDAGAVTDVYLRSLMPASTSLVSANPSTGNSGNGASSNAVISGNGDFVVFESLADDLDGGSVGVKDIYVRNLMLLPAIDIDRVNNPQSGIPATVSTDQPAISEDGRYVSFDSIAPYTTDDTDSLRDVFRVHNSTHP